MAGRRVRRCGTKRAEPLVDFRFVGKGAETSIPGLPALAL